MLLIAILAMLFVDMKELPLLHDFHCLVNNQQWNFFESY